MSVTEKKNIFSTFKVKKTGDGKVKEEGGSSVSAYSFGVGMWEFD